MKKLVIAAAVSAIAFASPALAASTANTIITANIASVCTIGAPGLEGVILGGAKVIGNLDLQCNSAGGFTAGVSSANNGKLTSGVSNNTTTYDYQLNIAPYGTFTPTSGPAGANITANPGDTSLLAAKHLPINVIVGTANGPEFAGNYSDTLTFYITAN